MSVSRLRAPWRLPAVPYGTEGVAPANQADCAYARVTGYDQSCLSGSGSSGCVGFFGAFRTADDSLEVECGTNDDALAELFGRRRGA